MGEDTFCSRKLSVSDKSYLHYILNNHQGLVHPLNTSSCSSFSLCIMSVQYLPYWLSMFSLKSTIILSVSVLSTECCLVPVAMLKSTGEGLGKGWAKGDSPLAKEGFIM